MVCVGNESFQLKVERRRLFFHDINVKLSIVPIVVKVVGLLDVRNFMLPSLVQVLIYRGLAPLEL